MSDVLVQHGCRVVAPGQRSYSAPASGARCRPRPPAFRLCRPFRQLILQPSSLHGTASPCKHSLRAPPRASWLQQATQPAAPYTARSLRRAALSHEHSAWRGLHALRGARREPQRAAALPDKDVSVRCLGTRRNRPPPAPPALPPAAAAAAAAHPTPTSPQRRYDLVDDPSTNPIVSWGVDGQR